MASNAPHSPRFDAARPPVVLLIARENVERCEIGPPLKALTAMANTPEATREYAGRVDLVFDGYEHDPRELYSIREVRTFVQTLTEEFPYWFHFCSKVDNSLWVLIQCLLPVGPVTVADGVATTKLNTAAWNKTTRRLFGYMNWLYAQHGLTSEENSATTQQVLQYVRTFMPEQNTK